VKFDQYQVSAFTQRQFGGNPAAVVPLEEWLPTEIMQAVAAENNLSETAFFVPGEAGFGLRWFTPTVEVDLCGHATLAAAHVLFNELGHPAQQLHFQTRSGELIVSRVDGAISMDFPVYPVADSALDPAIVSALGGAPVAAYESPFWLYRYDSEAEVRALVPDMRALLSAADTPIIATAPGDAVDFVSRFFGPQVGIDEDPVTGSAHCALVPLWSRLLGKDQLRALQVSARGGELDCELKGERVELRGCGLTFMRGQIELSL
jgi:predicted PhzF superfamily epimerase YddE/YHI9